MLLDQFLCLGDLLRLETEMCHQLQARVDPEFCFAVGVLNVDVSPPFLAGEKVEPEPLDPQNRRTHRSSIAQRLADWMLPRTLIDTCPRRPARVRSAEKKSQAQASSRFFSVGRFLMAPGFLRQFLQQVRTRDPVHFVGRDRLTGPGIFARAQPLAITPQHVT